MFDDVIIGKGNYGTGSTKVWQSVVKDHTISRNGASFWVTHVILDIDMIVFINTDEGQQIRELLKPTTNTIKSDGKLCDYLDTIALKHIKLPKLKKKLYEFKVKVYELGRESKMEEIKAVLGL